MYKPKLYLNKKHLQGKKEKKNEKEEEKREEKKENKGRKKTNFISIFFLQLGTFLRFVVVFFAIEKKIACHNNDLWITLNSCTFTIFHTQNYHLWLNFSKFHI